MATMQKLKPCPRCGTDEYLAIYKYESRWQHVECDKCYYLGPGEGSKIAAAKSYNETISKEAAQSAE